MREQRSYPVAYCGLHERQAALREGAAMLNTMWPRLQCVLVVSIAPNRVECYATFHWPGVVKVTRRWDGHLVAQSKPGRPLHLDLKALA